MLVSIIVPFYNVAPYFRRCLDSIVNQSYEKLEIILVDDCSSDTSLAIAQEYAQADHRIVIIEHKINKHQGGARNSALMRATGEYVWFIDSDDAVSSPYAVEHLVAVAKRDDADIVLFNAQLVIDNGEIQHPWHFYTGARERVYHDQDAYYPAYYSAIIDNVYDQTSLSPSACFGFYRRTFFAQYQFQFLEHTFYEDVPLLVLVPLAKKITQLPHIYYNYHLREGSTMRDSTRVNHLEYFERIATQLWHIYDTYWSHANHRKIIVPVILMYYPMANVKRTYEHLQLVEQAIHLSSLYDFLKSQLHRRLPFGAWNPWPKLLENQEQWAIVLASFEQSLSDPEKTQMIHQLLYPTPDLLPTTVKKKGVLAIFKYIAKKTLKMLLPYGVVRWIQIKKWK